MLGKISMQFFKIKPVGVLLIIIAGLASLPAFPQSDGLNRWSKSAGSLTIFQPGDAIRIQVWELYENQNNRFNLSADYSINPNGDIILPLVGEVRVKGLTVFELNQILEQKLRAYMKNPLVYVQPLIRVSLIGAFQKPGSYRVPPSSSLWEVIAIAGGPAGGANLKKLSVQRGGKIVITDILNSFEKGYSLEEIGVESGDQIVAPLRARWGVQTFLLFINVISSLALLYIRLRQG